MVEKGGTDAKNGQNFDGNLNLFILVKQKLHVKISSQIF